MTLQQEFREVRGLLAHARQRCGLRHRGETAGAGYASDPVRFAAEALGFSPDPWQAEVLASTSRRLLMNCSRQSGKSTVAAILAVHRAVHFPRSLVLAVSPSLRQSGELFRKCSDLLDLLAGGPRLEEDNRLSLTMENGSRIVSLPSKEATIRGFSGADLILEDEAARVPDELAFAISPMLAVSGGRLIAMSTPFGQRGHFHEAWTEGGASWERFEVPATLCPRIPGAFLAEERRTLPAFLFVQEYECQFTDVVDQIFTSEMIDACFSDDVEVLEL